MTAIQGCSYIYVPAGQAGEYAPLAANPYRGCGQPPPGRGVVAPAEGWDIQEAETRAYCYVPQVIKMPRPLFDAGAVPRPNFLRNLTKDAKKYQAAGSREQVMLSFTTDPYPPERHALTREVLIVLRDHGLSFCTLTKGGARALRDIDLFRPDRDAFASTLTSLDPEFSAKWERGAAPPAERIATLKAFHERGIFTWVSLEPTLDVEASVEIVRETNGFVDLYKVGRVNYLPMTRTTDWRSYTLRMIEQLQKLGGRHYIKKDLREFLPPGYPNPLRVPQHHGPAAAGGEGHR